MKATIDTAAKNAEIAKMLGWLFYASEQKWVLPKSLDDNYNYREWADTTSVVHGDGENRYSMTHYLLDVGNLMFHSDYNWMMEAVDFIEEKGHQTYMNFYPHSRMRSFTIYDIDGMRKLIEVESNFKERKQTIFDAVYQFAYYYNNEL